MAFHFLVVYLWMNKHQFPLRFHPSHPGFTSCLALRAHSGFGSKDGQYGNTEYVAVSGWRHAHIIHHFEQSVLLFLLNPWMYFKNWKPWSNMAPIHSNENCSQSAWIKQSVLASGWLLCFVAYCSCTLVLTPTSCSVTLNPSWFCHACDTHDPHTNGFYRVWEHFAKLKPSWFKNYKVMINIVCYLLSVAVCQWRTTVAGRGWFRVFGRTTLLPLALWFQ